MRRLASLLVALVVGCSGSPAPAPVADPPLSDPATWKKYTAEQVARLHFKSRLPDVRIELDWAELEGAPEDMNMSYSANDLDKERWWKVRIAGGQTEQFSEREGWVGRKLRDKHGIAP